jgi:hypothetical protein
VWESNPPPTCLEPDTGFEVRGVHRRRKRLHRGNLASNQRCECTTKAERARYCHLTRQKCHLTLVTPVQEGFTFGLFIALKEREEGDGDLVSPHVIGFCAGLKVVQR